MDRRNHFPFSRYCGLTSFHAADTVRLYTPAAYARVICRPLIFFVVVAVAVSFSFIKHSASLVPNCHAAYWCALRVPAISGGSSIYQRGTRIEASQALRGVGFGEGVCPSPVGRGLGRGRYHLPREKKSILDLNMATFHSFWTLFLQFSYLV